MMPLIRQSILRLRDGIEVFTKSGVHKFTRRNKTFWNEIGSHHESSGNVIISEQAYGSGYWALIVSITASLLAAALKARVVFLMQGKSPASKMRSVFQKSFCSCEFIYLGDVFELNKAVIKNEALQIFKTLTSPKDVLDIKYRGIPIGEQIYDSVLKHKHATLWRVDERVLFQIEQALNCVACVLDIMNSRNVLGASFTHSTGVYQGVAVRTVLSKNKPVFLGFGGTNALYRYNKLSRDRGQLDIFIKIPVRHFERILKTSKKELLAEAEKYYRKRFDGDINDWDAMRAFSQDKKLYRNREMFFDDFKNLNPENKNVFIMLHAMNDDPHVQVQHIFKDYYDWFAETLKIAKKNQSVNWIFKQHPMIKFYPDDANLHGLFDIISECKHIIYIDENVPFNQASVPIVADAIITCAGTAGLEFSAFGLPAVIAARNSYSGFDICHEPTTILEYEDLLGRIQKLDRLDLDRMERAKILFYIIYNNLIPSFQTGFFSYMNNDQMKAITEIEAVDIYLESLNKIDKRDLKELLDFISNDNMQNETDLYLRMK